ncbi:MAG: HNH endonuclease [Lachnospiraceae bacterium]|nr:HNH endonuclease [Lachnospiraceae bacterium]
MNGDILYSIPEAKRSKSQTQLRKSKTHQGSRTTISGGGEDSTTNTVALCPNCHKRMHVLDKPEDIYKLQEIIK